MANYENTVGWDSIKELVIESYFLLRMGLKWGLLVGCTTADGVLLSRNLFSKFRKTSNDVILHAYQTNIRIICVSCVTLYKGNAKEYFAEIPRFCVSVGRRSLNTTEKIEAKLDYEDT